MIEVFRGVAGVIARVRVGILAPRRERDAIGVWGNTLCKTIRVRFSVFRQCDRSAHSATCNHFFSAHVSDLKSRRHSVLYFSPFNSRGNLFTSGCRWLLVEQ